MKNSCSCVMCDGSPVPLTRTMTVLGKPLTVRNVECSPDGVAYSLQPPHRQLMLTLLLTQWCPAHCPFCIAGDHSGKKHIDLAQLEKVLRALKSEDALNYIAISGGEPMSEPQLLDETLSLIYEIFGAKLMVGVTSNGMNLFKVPTLKHLMDLDRFRISRHHSDDARNRQLFSFDVPSAAELKELISGIKADDLFAVNCLLLRDWVGSHDAVKKQLDFVGELGPALAAFITPNPVNEFAKEQGVDFHKIMRFDDPDLLFTREYHEQDTCHCRDGVAVTSSGRVVEFYGRSNRPGGEDYVRGLVYTAEDELRAGYGGQLLASPAQEVI